MKFERIHLNPTLLPSLPPRRDPELRTPRQAAAPLPGPAQFRGRVFGSSEATAPPHCPGERRGSVGSGLGLDS